MDVALSNPASITVCLAAIILAIWYFRSKHNNSPPGPTPIPVFGNLLQVAKENSFPDALTSYQRQYGNIFTLYFGSQPMYTICGHKLIREAFVTNAEFFSGRPWLTLTSEISGSSGIVFNPHTWKDNRKSSLLALRDFGLGKRSLEERVAEEARSLCDLLGSMEGQEVDIRPLMAKASSNVICTIVFGQRFEYDDPKFTHLMKLLDHIFASTMGQSTIIDFLPFTKYLPKFRDHFKNVMASIENIDKFIKECIAEHKESFDSENLRDVIDLYVKADPSNEDSAIAIIKELFVAGSETSGTTLTWAFLLLAKYPEIQTKCRQEIKEVLGSSRAPMKSDKGTLHYTEATLMEAQRLISITPVSLPHVVAEDITFADYNLKKGSTVFALLDSCHHDPEVWPDHDKFRPERWLDDCGKFDPTTQSFMPFSVGRRTCLGEQLARLEIFMVFVSILQQFEFSPVPNRPVSLKGSHGITYAPNDSQLVYRRKLV